MALRGVWASSRVDSDGAVAFEDLCYGGEDAIADNHVLTLPCYRCQYLVDRKDLECVTVQSLVPLGVLS